MPTPELRTQRLILREICEGDWKEILHLRSDPLVNELVNRSETKTREDAIAFIKKVIGSNTSQKIAYWGLVLPERNEVFGTICLWNFSEDQRTAEVGYELAAAHQGFGLMSEALKAVLDFGFNELHLATVEAYTQANNVASTKLLGKFGFGLLTDRKDETNVLNSVYALQATKRGMTR